MIYSLEGIVKHIGERFVVLETAGIGFKVNVLDSFVASVEVGKTA
jgi:Holliday junction resolvasome RuvABC DNA-binding subunit